MYREQSKLIPPHLEEDGESSAVFVEGECEKALIETLIQSFGILPPGKIKVLNICQKTFPPSLIFFSETKNMYRICL